MSLKIISLVGLGLSTATFATWGGLSFHDNYQYNSRMWEYEQWREEFFSKIQKNSIEDTICENKTNCTGGKEYLPKPYENELWEKAYKDYKNRYSSNPYNIKDLEEWKDYCYGEIKKDNDKQGSFNPSGQTPGHDSCVLSKNQLKK